MSYRLSRNGQWLLVLFMLLGATNAGAQTEKCGIKHLNDVMLAKDPSFREVLEREYQPSAHKGQLKTTAASPVPVVFHVVLTQAQLNQIGGEAGVRQRIDSEMVVLNRDFNGANADSVKIPAPFKPLYANAGILFGLAHTTPTGDSTAGYEIRVITKNGTELTGGYGSGNAFSDAKYKAAYGLDAWDPTSYLNVWVVNTWDGGKTSTIIGVAIPHYYTEGSNGLPVEEQGVVLNYGAFGVKTLPTDYYISTSSKGRTLTHETGHMFYLKHPWGDDDGKCPDDGGSDDGIEDTPPEASYTSGCPNFPRYDRCTRTGNGVMFMNYMDYVNDDCMYLFTKGQAALMQSHVAEDGVLFSLTQHPELLNYPAAGIPKNVFSIYPNPATKGVVNIIFDHTSEGLTGIRVTDMTGKLVAEEEINVQAASYSVDLNAASTGLYFVQLYFASGVVTKRVLVN